MPFYIISFYTFKNIHNKYKYVCTKMWSIHKNTKISINIGKEKKKENSIGIVNIHKKTPQHINKF